MVIATHHLADFYWVIQTQSSGVGEPFIEKFVDDDTMPEISSSWVCVVMAS